MINKRGDRSTVQTAYNTFPVCFRFNLLLDLKRRRRIHSGRRPVSPISDCADDNEVGALLIGEDHEAEERFCSRRCSNNHDIKEEAEGTVVQGDDQNQLRRRKASY